MAKSKGKKKHGGRRSKKAGSAVDPATTVCKFQLEGKCKFGEECKFVHPADAPSKLEVKTDAASVEVAAKAGPVEATPKRQSSSLIGGAMNVAGSIAGAVLSPFSPRSKVILPAALESSMSLFTPSQQELARKLCGLPGSTNQCHLFAGWSDDAKFDDQKKAMMAKLESVDESYPDGGLVGYLTNAVGLLEKSRRGENPLEGWKPSVPQGEAFEVGTAAFLSTEELGLKEVGKCGFVLVAGGLGERLGYGDIKVSV